MALTVKTAPSNTAAVSNEMVFVIDEPTKANDEVTYPNYKYVLDIYVSATLVARLKVTPDPTYRFGIFDVSSILRNYAPDYGLNASANKVDYDVFTTYQCKLGEEYSDTTYLNLVTDSERTFYRSYKKAPFNINTTYITAGLASNRGSITTVNRGELYNLVSYYSNVSGITDLSIDQYDKSNTLLSNTTVSNSDYVANKGRQFNILGLITMQPTTEYLILGTLFTHRINIVCEKYPVITLAFLNSYGLYETQSFGYVSKKSIEIEKKSFQQLPYQINASGEVSYKANNVMYGANKDYTATVNTEMRLTSHLLSDSEYTWLSELFISPDVYYYDSVLAAFVPVKIKSTNYEHRTYLNSGVRPLEFEIAISNVYNSQLL